MKKNKAGIALFLLPATMLFVLVFGVSLVILFFTSFTDWAIGLPITWNGIGNYIELFKDSSFRMALKNTLVWIVLQSTVHVFIGVLLALILIRKKFYWKFTRTVYMIPNIISSAALGMMFSILLNPQIGGFNRLLQRLGFEEFDVNWFVDRRTAFISVTLVWLLYAATITILVMAEIESIDASIYEAAQVDGASQFQTSIYIILPLMRKIIGTSAILGATSILQKLDVLMMTTQGGPSNLTLNLPLYIYDTALINNNFSLANTAGVFLIVLGLVIVSILNKVFKTSESDVM